MDAKVLVLGLDNAGKTTIMGLMVHDAIRQNPPTGHACASPPPALPACSRPRWYCARDAYVPCCRLQTRRSCGCPGTCA